MLAGATALAAPAIVRAQGDVPVRVGEINSYTAVPGFTLPYRNGWQLGMEAVNAGGGVMGRKLEIVSRDDGGQAQNAVRLAGELVNDQKVDLLAGGFLSNIGLALSDFAQRSNRLYVAGEPLADALVWEKGNSTCFRLRPSTYMQVAMLIDAAAGLPGTRWVTVAPNYEYGQSAVKWFRQLLAARRPDVQFVGEQWPALGRIDAEAIVQALEAVKPDAIFNVTFGTDLTSFVREGNSRNLFAARGVVSVLTGEPEYLDALAGDTPEGWIVTGYPWTQITEPAHVAFVKAYRQRFRDYPRMGSVVGYALVRAIAAGITRSGGTDTARMRDGFKGAAFATPIGQAMFRAVDHQSTLGTYVGRTALKDGHGTMVDWHYADGATVLPGDDAVKRLRPDLT